MKPFTAFLNRSSAPCVRPNLTLTPPLFRDLHWLPVVALIRLKMMALAYKVAVNGAAPAYLQALVRTTQPGLSAPLNHCTAFFQLNAWYRHRYEQAKVHHQSHNSSLFWNVLPADVRVHLDS